jgi:GSH-dependent disulfide-bond oxidoreductase
MVSLATVNHVEGNNSFARSADQTTRTLDDGGKPISVFESGAILVHLAEKTRALVPPDLRGRKTVLEWVFCAIERYVKETNRLYGVLDRHLAGREFIAGNTYTIANIAAYPWVVPWKRQQQDLDSFPNLRRWFNAARKRPATQRAYARGEPFASRPARALTNRA